MSLKYSRLTGASVSCRVKRRDCTKWSPGLSSSRLWLFLPLRESSQPREEGAVQREGAGGRVRYHLGVFGIHIPQGEFSLFHFKVLKLAVCCPLGCVSS